MAMMAPEGGTYVPTDDRSEGTAMRLPKLLVIAGLASSSGEATRKLKENAVSVNGEKVSAAVIDRAALGEEPVLRLGKRAVRVRWA